MSTGPQQAAEPVQTNGLVGLLGSNLPMSIGPALPPQATGKQINLNFDSLNSFQNVESLYQEVHFSSPGHTVYVWTNNIDARSFSNSITRGIGFSNDHKADLVVDFPQPVNNLTFYISGIDTFFGPIAQMDYSRNGTTTSNLQISGNGFKAPIPVQLQLTGISQVRIHNVVDPNGITFDDFSFTVPAASPTPTPTPIPSPTPPSAPGTLRTLPDEEAIDLQWTASAGASGYTVQLVNADPTAKVFSNQMAVVDGTNANGFATVAVLPAGTTTFHHANLSSDVEYTYVVSAMGSGGTSANSNEASAEPLAKPGCNWEAEKKKYTTKPPAVDQENIVESELGWKLTYVLTADDGLVVRNVYLNGRKMADQFSIPYYKISTIAANPTPPERGELMVNGSGRQDGKLFSRLLGVKVSHLGFELLIQAEYGIDNIPGAPKSCLKIAQVFEFFAKGFLMPDDAHQQGPCEPSGSISSCTKFRPSVTYEFHPGPGESLSSINIPQRLSFDVDENQPLDNTVVFSRDRDGFESVQQAIPDEDVRKIFSQYRIPVLQEEFFPVVKPGLGNKDNGSMDNLHQTNYPLFIPPKIDPNSESRLDPDILPGCPECVHMHWRWSAKVKPEVFKGPSGAGQPLVPANSPQSLDVAILRFNNSDTETDPQDYGLLLNKEIIARRFPNLQRFPSVLWYSSHGFTNQDTFFWNPAWFNFDRTPPPVPEQLHAMSAEASNSLDGPTSIQFARVFREGTNSFELMTAQELPPLPAGYALLSNTGFRVTTTTIGTGPFLIKFLVNSVSAPTTFANLRIFHLDKDPFDPDKRIWVDTTVRSPDSPSPDFTSRTIYARGQLLGVYVIGNLIQTIPPDTSVADLSAECVDSTDPIVAENTLTYTATIRNNGPQTATEVVFQNELSSFVRTDSFTSSQGTTKFLDGTIYGTIGTLAPGASATFTVVVKPSEGYGGSFPPEGKDIFNWLAVRAKQSDSNLDNNAVTVSTRVLPSPNRAPSVTLTAPIPGNPIVGPTQIIVRAVATDPDGSISKVRFYDNSALVGEVNGNGSSQFTVTHNNVGPGAHEYIAVATDNLGRMSVSESVEVVVNGPASVSLTSPTEGFAAAPGSNIQLAAQASHPSGTVSEVEFVANGQHIGHGVAVGGGSYTFNWENVLSNVYTIYAVATDSAGVQSRSLARSITVNTAPTVSVVTPFEGQRFNSSPNIGLTAVADDSDGQIAKIDFYANNILIGTATDVVTSRFNFTWRNVADGQYTLSAIATDNLGVSSTSSPVNIGVNATALRPGVTIWFDDAVPAGATTQGAGDVKPTGEWYWVEANPGAFSGTKSHQSRNFKLVTAPAIHSHSFQNATAKLHVDATDKLFTYVFLDANNMPREVMLEWKDASGSEHRAYWGANNIDLGVDGTSSRRFMGQLPRAGEWMRLEVPASLVGFSNNDLDGMKFILDGGRATWDFSGKTAFNYSPPPTTPNMDTNWVDGSLPPGAVPDFPDDWRWVPCGVAVACHESVLDGQQLHEQHRFKGATPQLVNPGDQLFTYVAIDPANKPDQLFLEWHDGTTWHGAFWGRNFRAVGVTGTESWRYMGGLPSPPAGAYVRLETPASYVGLEGKSVSGMEFGFFKETGNALITWGRSGKTKAIGPVPVVLSAIAPVYQFFHDNLGYYYETKEVRLHNDDHENDAVFLAYPNEAAGTVPMYRYANTTKREFFYSTCGTSCGFASVWRRDGIAFYVYKNDDPRPGTVALHMYHDNVKFQYFLSTTPPEIPGKTHDGIWGYVYELPNKLVPARPSFLTWTGSSCQLSWLDNSSDETGFRIEKRTSSNPSWTTVTTVGPGITSKADCTLINSVLGDTDYRVFAYNNIGDSLPSNEVLFTRVKRCRGCVWTNVDTATGDPPAESDDPSVNIVSPVEGSIVSKNLVINANVFDIDGNGSIAKIEFFDGVKLGELPGPPPYNFIWNNIPNGPHTLTVKVTDGSGMTATSAPVHITVSAVPSVTLTTPASDTVIAFPGSVTLQASASDDGTVAKVEFFSGDVKIGEDTTSPYSFAWSNIQAGTYVITARATDNVGLTTTSGLVKLTVNSAPSVTLSAPTNGAIVQAPGGVLLVADVVDTDGTINKVDFYRGTTLLGTSTTFPYFYNWTNIPFGTYSITAKATDNYGAETTCAPVNLIVNSVPSVSITSPANLAMFAPSSSVSISANASDPDGTISKVDFYQGTTLIGTDTTPPFSTNWSNVASGSYVLSAQATDNRGATTTSLLLAVTTPTFFDDFNDNSLNTSKWTVLSSTSPAQVSEQGQQLRITLPASVATYNGVVSNATYDMRGATAQVEVAQAVSQAGWVENYFKLESDAQNYFLIDAGAGNTLFRSMVNGVNDQTIIPFDSVAHRFWRLRHNATSNQVSFDTSPDAVTWTTRKTVTAGFPLTGMRFSLLAGAWGTNNAAPGAAIYNDLQYISSAETLLSDDYNDNTIDTVKWTTNDLLSGFTDNSLPITETLQRLEIGPLLSGTSGSHYRGIRSITSYNFTGGRCSVELVQPPAASTTAYAMFTIGSDVDNFYRLYVSGGTLVGERKVGGTKTTLFTISYIAQNHKFLGIRHDPATNNMVMETAPSNGAGPGTWTQQYVQSWSSGIQLTTIMLELKGGTSVAEASAPGKVIFDNFSAIK